MNLPPGEPTQYTLPEKAARIITVLAAIGMTFAASYFILPFLQIWTLPVSPDGARESWIIRPIVADHMCACAFLCAVTTPFLLRTFYKKWRVNDAQRCPMFRAPSGSRKWGLYIQGSLLGLIYFTALGTYLSAYEKVSSDGVTKHLPYRHKTYPYSEVVSLESIPAGYRSDERARDGPYYEVTFRDDTEFDFSPDNEGLSEEQSAAIAKFIADQSHRPWRDRKDIRRLQK